MKEFPRERAGRDRSLRDVYKSEEWKQLMGYDDLPIGRNAIDKERPFEYKNNNINIKPQYVPTPVSSIKTGYCVTQADLDIEFARMNEPIRLLMIAIGRSDRGCEHHPGYTGDTLTLHLEELRHRHTDITKLDDRYDPPKAYVERMDPCKLLACNAWNVDLTLLVESIKRNTTLKRIFLTMIDEDHHYVVLEPLYDFFKLKPKTQIESIYVNAQQVFYQPLQVTPPQQYTILYQPPPVIVPKVGRIPILLTHRNRSPALIYDTISYDTPVTVRTPEEIAENNEISSLIDSNVWNDNISFEAVSSSESDGYDTSASESFTSPEEYSYCEI